MSLVGNMPLPVYGARSCLCNSFTTDRKLGIFGMKRWPDVFFVQNYSFWLVCENAFKNFTCCVSERKVLTNE